MDQAPSPLSPTEREELDQLRNTLHLLEDILRVDANTDLVAGPLGMRVRLRARIRMDRLRTVEEALTEQGRTMREVVEVCGLEGPVLIRDLPRLVKEVLEKRAGVPSEIKVTIPAPDVDRIAAELSAALEQRLTPLLVGRTVAAPLEEPSIDSLRDEVKALREKLAEAEPRLTVARALRFAQDYGTSARDILGATEVTPEKAAQVVQQFREDHPEVAARIDSLKSEIAPEGRLGEEPLTATGRTPRRWNVLLPHDRDPADLSAADLERIVAVTRRGVPPRPRTDNPMGLQPMQVPVGGVFYFNPDAQAAVDPSTQAPVSPLEGDPDGLARTVAAMDDHHAKIIESCGIPAELLTDKPADHVVPTEQPVTERDDQQMLDTIYARVGTRYYAALSLAFSHLKSLCDLGAYTRADWILDHADLTRIPTRLALGLLRATNDHRAALKRRTAFALRVHRKILGESRDEATAHNLLDKLVDWTEFAPLANAARAADLAAQANPSEVASGRPGFLMPYVPLQVTPVFDDKPVVVETTLGPEDFGGTDFPDEVADAALREQERRKAQPQTAKGSDPDRLDNELRLVKYMLRLHPSGSNMVLPQVTPEMRELATQERLTIQPTAGGEYLLTVPQYRQARFYPKPEEVNRLRTLLAGSRLNLEGRRERVDVELTDAVQALARAGIVRIRSTWTARDGRLLGNVVFLNWEE